MGLGLGLKLWGSTVGHPSNSWASCTHTYPDYQPSFISFLHLLQSIASSLTC